MLVPLVLTDEHLIRLVDEALAGSKIVGVFTQRNRDTEHPGPGDIYHTGCAMLIQKMARFQDGQVRILGQGIARVEIVEMTDDTPFMRARVRVVHEPDRVSDRTKAITRNATNAFLEVVDASENYPEEIKGLVQGIKDPGRLADMLAANLEIGIEEKQHILELHDPGERIAHVYEFISGELEIARIGEKIRHNVRQEMDKEQREYYLRQQIKAIRKELGEEDAAVELDELKTEIDETPMPATAREAALKEWRRLRKMSTNSAEYTVARTYLGWLLDLPWEVSTEDAIDIRKAARILDRDHYDLAVPKERILEFLSVKTLSKSLRGSILCFVGPPGVGKTSFGRSIARAMGRRFVRISLGGIRDEAEIRGHRRTYIGALPGRIIQGIRTAGSNNPVFMLDEIDKLGHDFRGDPASALLEVLDPEQNHSFEDNYINTPFDLSRTMFITTANVTHTIPGPLLDRMEIIELPGYITREKVQIARRFLVPRQLEENGVPVKKLAFSDGAIAALVERYTREAGVRNLDRRIASVARKVARRIVEGKRGSWRVTPRNLTSYIGSADHVAQEKLKQPTVGVSTGMAKTATGGVILFVEALGVKGHGATKLTGQLGDVMKESAEAAMSFIRAHYSHCLRDDGFFENTDIHLHIPAGAVPKDGPSAGVAIATAIASLALDDAIRDDVAMTGEITLTGKVLPVGAIRDKVIAAHRAGIREVILPAANRNDVEDVPREVTRDVRFRFIERVDDCIAAALTGSGCGRRPRRRRRADDRS
ncbi:MAG: endopeptidase La [Candidatus Krumholzibacteriota bacterium]|nr:endopeptidase La [Candidatus Krumholzibacteriota bacterium]